MSTRKLEYIRGLLIDGTQGNFVIETFDKPYLLSGLTYNGFAFREGSQNGVLAMVILVARAGTTIGSITSLAFSGTLYEPEDHVWAYQIKGNIVTGGGPTLFNLDGQEPGTFSVRTGDALVVAFKTIENMTMHMAVSYDLDNF